MKKIILFFLTLQIAAAQLPTDDGGLICAKAKLSVNSESLIGSKLRYPGDNKIDVKYYFLNLKIDPNSRRLTGAVQVDFMPAVDNVNSLFLDLNNSFQVDSVTSNRQKLTFSHSGGKLNITLGKSYTKSDLVSLVVYYQGVPVQNNNNISIKFTSHSGQPVIWTLSEPYDAPTWWPCVDNPADKADSCDVWINLPAFYTAVSQGDLVEISRQADGTNTTKWKHRYPIAHYLISIAASNYVLKTSYFKPTATDSMVVMDYLYPESAANVNVINVLNTTIPQLSVFSEAFGQYPFLKEKYGHAMFGFGGGMEHQTISSMGGFNFSLIAHELAHQWFGDQVTCKTWRDIWVNEGFAEFGSMYAAEKLQGKAAYNALVKSQMEGAKTTNKTIAIANPSNVNEIFDYALSYQKGSVVVHTLRGVLGDEVFFRVLREYQNTEFAYGVASIEDFKMVAERVTNKDLTWFFEEWIFGKGYPKYQYTFSPLTGNKLRLVINHSGSHPDTPLFKMPVQVKIVYKDNQSELRTVEVEANSQVFELSNLQPQEVKDVVFDPENWIMKTVSSFTGPNVLSQNQPQVNIYPNPGSELLKLEGQFDYYTVCDIQGRILIPKSTEAVIKIKNLPEGRFFVKFFKDDQLTVKQFVKN